MSGEWRSVIVTALFTVQGDIVENLPKGAISALILLFPSFRCNRPLHSISELRVFLWRQRNLIFLAEPNAFDLIIEHAHHFWRTRRSGLRGGLAPGKWTTELRFPSSFTGFLCDIRSCSARILNGSAPVYLSYLVQKDKPVRLLRSAFGCTRRTLKARNTACSKKSSRSSAPSAWNEFSEPVKPV